MAVLTVRNEAAFLLDWLAHHQAVGFTDFLIFSNNCQDGTDRLLDRLDTLGLVRHIRNDGPYDQRGVQFTALKQAEKLDIVQRADWILALDIDEYVNIHIGDHTLQALIDALPEANAITLTWRLFGNNGVVEYTDTPVTQTFTQAAPIALKWPWRAAMFKTLYRNDGTYRKLGVHRPRSPDSSRLKDVKWFDGEGRRLPRTFHTSRIFSDYGRSNYRLVQLNHYALGAMQSFVLKADRGRAVHSEDLLGLDYWVERNFCQEKDTTISSLSGQTAKFRSDLHADSILADLHQRAVNWRHERFDLLLGNELFRTLFGRLLVTPPSNPVPLAWAEQILHHAIKSKL